MEVINDKDFLEHERHIANLIKTGIMVFTKTSGDYDKCIFFNDYLLELLGYEADEFNKLVNSGKFALVFPADRDLLETASQNSELGKNGYSARLVCKDGSCIWTLGHAKVVLLNGEEVCLVAISNVSDLIGAQRRLESRNNEWEDIVNSVPVGLCIYSIVDGNGLMVAMNDSFVSFSNEIGCSLDGNARNYSREELAMLFNQNLFLFCMEEDIPKAKKMLEDSETKHISSCRFRLRGSNAEKTVWIYAICRSKENDNGGRTYYITFQDVSKEAIQEKEIMDQRDLLFELSYHDPLTKVNNRNAYNQFILNCQTNQLKDVGIAFADLNGLKNVNDNLGHSMGDMMLTRFARIIMKYFSVCDIYRISGDEFVMVQENISKADFQERMRLLIEEVHEENDIASIGYIWKENASDIKRRTKQAENIMYVEKQKYYESERNVTSKHRPIVLNTLLNDLQNNRFVMFLQPKTDVNTSKVIGAEALVRKLDENGKIVPPYEFVPMLEKERLIPKIDLFMLEEVCKFLEKLKKQGKEDFKISVNMSRVTLVENDYIETISDICEKYDFNRSQLEFEITESNETMDTNRLEDYLKQIKALGIGVSLDDVGTDYSSLSLMLLEGVDTVKIDRSLVIKINDQKANKMLKHVIHMSHDLGLTVIAEGVETDDVRVQLRDMDCDVYQGYLMSKPIPSMEFEEKFL